MLRTVVYPQSMGFHWDVEACSSSSWSVWCSEPWRRECENRRSIDVSQSRRLSLLNRICWLIDVLLGGWASFHEFSSATVFRRRYAGSSGRCGAFQRVIGRPGGGASIPQNGHARRKIRRVSCEGTRTPRSEEHRTNEAFARNFTYSGVWDDNEVCSQLSTWGLAAAGQHRWPPTAVAEHCPMETMHGAMYWKLLLVLEVVFDNYRFAALCSRKPWLFILRAMTSEATVHRRQPWGNWWRSRNP